MQKPTSGNLSPRLLVNTSSPLVKRFICAANALQGCKAPVLGLVLRTLAQKEAPAPAKGVHHA